MKSIPKEKKNVWITCLRNKLGMTTALAEQELHLSLTNFSSISRWQKQAGVIKLLGK